MHAHADWTLWLTGLMQARPCTEPGNSVPADVRPLPESLARQLLWLQATTSDSSARPASRRSIDGKAA